MTADRYMWIHIGTDSYTDKEQVRIGKCRLALTVTRKYRQMQANTNRDRRIQANTDGYKKIQTGTHEYRKLHASTDR